MGYAVLQKELSVPPVERLKRAFRSVKGLTAFDAQIIANDAYGILVRNMGLPEANTLQANLRAEGIETDVVDERQLPVLPNPKFVQRLDCTPEALMIYDPLGRPFPLEWRHILLIAAGGVRLSEFKRIRTETPVVRYTPDGYAYTDTEVEHRSREERNYHLLLEIVITRAALRYSATAEQLKFQYLGSRRTDNQNENFRLLVQDLAQFAPQAVINRGAYYLRENSGEPFAYPTKNSFFEEIIWLLWRAQSGGT